MVYEVVVTKELGSSVTLAFGEDVPGVHLGGTKKALWYSSQQIYIQYTDIPCSLAN
jgi:hypothetical protein